MLSNDRCPWCDLAGDGLLNWCAPSATKGRYSNGSTMWSPVCGQCGDIGAVGTANSEGTAKHLASITKHPWGKAHYCQDPWHIDKEGGPDGNV